MYFSADSEFHATTLLLLRIEQQKITGCRNPLTQGYWWILFRITYVSFSTLYYVESYSFVFDVLLYIHYSFLSCSSVWYVLSNYPVISWLSQYTTLKWNPILVLSLCVKFLASTITIYKHFTYYILYIGSCFLFS